MHKKLSILILGNSGRSVKQMTVSKKMIGFFSFALIGCLLTLSYVIFDYYNLHKDMTQNKMLSQLISEQRLEITEQQKQIEKFATEINTLKTKLVSLNSFEKKIRIIANLDTVKDQEGIFGVGGAMPEDIDPKIEVQNSNADLLREMHEQVNLLDHAYIKQGESFESLYLRLEEKHNLLASTPAIKPVNGGWITSRFGKRKSPFTGRREFHKGLDIAAQMGFPIIATANGIVTYVGTKGLLGKTIVVNHGHGMMTRYAHCKEILKKQGDKVKRGDTIARVGNSGRSTGPHVHYEVHLNGMPINPSKYILN